MTAGSSALQGESRSMRRTSLLVAAVLAAMGTAFSLPGASGHPAPGSAGGESAREVVQLLPLPAEVRDIVVPDLPEPAPAGSTPDDELPRATENRPDLVEGPQIRAVYMVASDVEDERLDIEGSIDRSIRSIDRWFTEHTGGLRFRFDMAEVPAPGGGTREIVDVTFVKASRDAATLGEGGIVEVEAELTEKGFDSDGTRYIVYAHADSGPVCGQAYWSGAYDLLFGGEPDPSLQYSVVNLDSVAGCRGRDLAASVERPGWVEATVLQELLHNDGLVPLAAVHQCLSAYGHVCTPGLAEALSELDPESKDVLFPYAVGPLLGKTIDAGNDDYFGRSLPLPGRDLRDSPYLVGN